MSGWRSRLLVLPPLLVAGQRPSLQPVTWPRCCPWAPRATEGGDTSSETRTARLQQTCLPHAVSRRLSAADACLPHAVQDEDEEAWCRTRVRTNKPDACLQQTGLVCNIHKAVQDGLNAADNRPASLQSDRQTTAGVRQQPVCSLNHEAVWVSLAGAVKQSPSETTTGGVDVAGPNHESVVNVVCRPNHEADVCC